MRDHGLIARVEASKTGANCHEVNQILSAYKSYCDIDEDSKRNESYKDDMDKCERILRAFVFTGKMDRNL